MSSTRRAAAWLIWAAAFLIGAAGMLLLLSSRARLSPIDLPGPYVAFVIATGYGSLGLVIVRRRPGHAMGWLFLGFALAAALSFFGEQYAVYGWVRPGRTLLPGAQIMAWLSKWLFYMVFPGGLALPYMLFPDGRLPSRRWRPLAWLAVLASLAISLGAMTEAGRIELSFTSVPTPLPLSNPTGIQQDWLREAQNILWPVGLLPLLLALAAPVVRYRRARGLERAQLKWFTYFVALTLLSTPLAFIEEEAIGSVLISLLVLILPVATTIAILRHRLYDIDVIIRRTLVYTLLTALLVGLYAGSVVLFQEGLRRLTGQASPLAVVASTLLIAALFSPLRQRVQGLIDRRFFRRKYDAHKTLEAFAAFARDEVELEQLAAELLRVTTETMQPERVSLWLAPVRARAEEGG